MQELEVLKSNNFKFSKKFGQNFIFDQNLLRAIVEDSGITSKDDVLEIGPGAGTLTKIIAENCNKVVSYEIDKTLEPTLKQNLQNQKNSQIIFKDALKTDIKEIEQNFKSTYKIVANIPYYITTPLILKFVEQSQKVESITIMIQKEVGDRLCAKAGSKNYGAISAYLAYFGDIKVLRSVPRHMFVPVPNVDSCIVQINLNKNYDVNILPCFKNVVKFAFINRRKTLVNNLLQAGYKREQINQAILSLGFDLSVRGEVLTTAQFVDLAEFIQDNKN